MAVRRWLDNATLALAAYTGTDKPVLAQQVAASSSPMGPPLNTDGAGCPNDLPFMVRGYSGVP